MQNPIFKIDVANGNELTIRTGEAMPLREPKQISITGDIHSVSSFLNGRTDAENFQHVDKKKAIVIVKKSERTLTLKLDPNDEIGTEITGKLKLTEELQLFNINTTKTFTRDELVKLLRFNSRFFPDRTKYEQLLRAYQTMQIKTAAELSQNSDTRGNRENNFVKTVDSSNIPNEFVLKVPIFEGFESETFRVEICLDATDASVRFWFESVELHELIESGQQKIFKEQLEHCKGLVVINS